MENSNYIFNSREVAKILGVNVSTIKRWTEEGKLGCNRTAGGHRKFNMYHLIDFIQKNKQVNPPLHLLEFETEEDIKISYDILRGNFDSLINLYTNFALENKKQNLQEILNGLYLAKYPLYQIYDRLVTPALNNLGNLWENNQLSIIEEHVATQAIRDSVIQLKSIVKIPAEKKSVALLVNFPAELHDIALKMVEYILEENGIWVLFSGQITPLSDIESVFIKNRPKQVYISSTLTLDNATDILKIQTEFDQLVSIASEYSVEIIIGGRGFDKIKYANFKNTTRLYNFEQLVQFINR